MRIIKLHFKSPIHVGYKEGILESTLRTIPSDLLFSVFCNAYRKLYGRVELEAFLESCRDRPAFTLTSTFPFYRNELYLPCPAALDLTQYGFLSKAAKKVKYVSVELFQKAITGELRAKDFNEYEETAIQGVLVKKEQPRTPIFYEREIPRVSLDRVNSVSNIYYFTELCFAKDAGLYFGTSEMDNAFWQRYIASWRLAADEGIGGDRSVGKGHFSIELAGELKFTKIKEPESQVLLSRYYPRPDEVANLDGEYTLQKCMGYMYSLDETARRKKSLMMMAEGSVFYQEKPLVGQMIDVTPEGFKQHQVYVSGYAMAVPSRIGKGGILS